ncbi:MAG: efflux transporter periplasmic adaptor subunit, partial [Ignavibacteriales bacterium]|nr:efflux transporter periplasmic adaptor subunit [Ignavibacteriales bacterium]
LRSAKRNTLLISENIIQLVDRNKYIVYVEQSGKAEERIVKLGGRQGKLVEILDGLRPGDRVITVGFEKLVNGQLVTIAG